MQFYNPFNLISAYCKNWTGLWTELWIFTFDSFMFFSHVFSLFACLTSPGARRKKSVTKIHYSHYSMAAVSAVECSGESSDFELHGI